MSRALEAARYKVTSGCNESSWHRFSFFSLHLMCFVNGSRLRWLLPLRQGHKPTLGSLLASPPTFLAAHFCEERFDAVAIMEQEQMRWLLQEGPNLLNLLNLNTLAKLTLSEGVFAWDKNFWTWREGYLPSQLLSKSDWVSKTSLLLESGHH